MYRSNFIFGTTLALMISLAGCSGPSVPAIKTSSTIDQMLDISKCEIVNTGTALECVMQIKQGGGVEAHSLYFVAFDKDDVKIDEGTWPMNMGISPGQKSKVMIFVNTGFLKNEVASVKLAFNSNGI